MAEALESARAQHPGILGAKARALAKDEGVSRARAAFLPNVSAHAEIGSATEPRSPSLQQARDARAARYDVLATQPLFDGGRAISGLRTAKADAGAERAAQRAVEDQTMLAAVTAYADVALYRRLLELHERNVALLGETGRTTRQKLAAREATSADVAQAEAAVAGAQAQVQLTRATLAGSEAGFVELMQHAPGRLEPIPAVDQLLPTSQQHALELAQRESPAVAASQLRTEAAHHGIAQAEAQLLPTVSLQAGYQGQNGAGVGLGLGIGDDNALVAKVVGVVPIYSGGAIEAETRAARYAHMASVYQLADTKAQIATAVVQAWSRITASRAALKSIRAQHAANQKALLGIKEEQEVGQRTVIELITAQQAVLASRTAIEQTQRNLDVAAFALLELAGGIDPASLGSRQAARQSDAGERQVNAEWRVTVHDRQAETKNAWQQSVRRDQSVPVPTFASRCGPPRSKCRNQKEH